MKNTLKKLESLKSNLAKEFTKRDAIYTNRSETWQESDKGVAYDVNTALLIDVAKNIDDAIANVKLFLKD